MPFLSLLLLAKMCFLADFGLNGNGGQGGGSDGQQAGFGRDFGSGQSGAEI